MQLQYVKRAQGMALHLDALLVLRHAAPLE